MSQYCMHENQESWWEKDARGIPLCRVCDKCYEIKLSAYRGDVKTDPRYWTDEPVEECQ